MNMSDKRWYVGQGESWTGPYNDSEIVRRIQDGNISWVDFVWNPAGGMKWQRICMMEAFQSFLPRSPSNELIREILSTSQAPSRSAALAPAPAPAPQRRSIWFLQFDGSEFGPLALAEVQVILKSGKLKDLQAWREGMKAWLPVEQIAELQGDVQKVAEQKEKSDERRKSKRVPLVATVRFNIPEDTTAGARKYMGACRDISAQGLLVLSNRVPLGPVDSIQMEVSPLGASGVEPFVAEVEVIRVLPDKKGFSVRFKKLSDRASAAIQQYLAKS